MDAPVTISLDTQQDSQNFAFLREEGMKVIRRIAPDTWTDHNLHDPGDHFTGSTFLCHHRNRVDQQPGYG
jgi:hypothetical protein